MLEGAEVGGDGRGKAGGSASDPDEQGLRELGKNGLKVGSVLEVSDFVAKFFKGFFGFRGLRKFSTWANEAAEFFPLFNDCLGFA